MISRTLQTLSSNRNLIFKAVLLIYILSSAYIILFFDGTGHEADSITHYLFARFAPYHGELYLDHWAKPIFTLLASPFAQFGFIGIKIFNSTCFGITMWLIYKVCKELGLQHAYFAPLFYFLFPLSFLTTYSGLTEPLFALFLITGILLIARNRMLTASILISFCPFIRSEGLVILFAFGIYFILKRQWKALPLLLLGHFIMACVGSIYYEDFLWIFNKIPYAKLDSPYGNGNWFHFFDKLVYALGIPLYVLLGIGFFTTIFSHFKGKKLNTELAILVILSFVLFFISHSTFWALGIFNSMGLKRVFAAITPLLAIIALVGFNNSTYLIPKKFSIYFKFVFMGYIVIFPFTSNPAAVDWEEDLCLSQKQRSANELGDFIRQENLLQNKLIYGDPYLSLILDIDPFKKEVFEEFSPLSLKSLKGNELVIWDSWHIGHDHNMSLPELLKTDKLTLVKTFSDQSEGQIFYAVFRATKR